MARFLESFDPATWYGLRAVELRHAVGPPAVTELLGRYRYGGLIVLFEVCRDCGLPNGVFGQLILERAARHREPDAIASTVDRDG